MAHKGRGNADDALSLALACGATAEQAAAKAGVSVRTVRRRLQDSAFADRVKELRRETVERTAALLTAAAVEAVKTLLGLQKEGVKHPVRLAAARSILELGVKFRELAELEGELRELEKEIEAIKADRGAA